MPVYSFECPVCGNYMEEYFKMSDMPDDFPCTCGSFARRIIAYAPALGTSNFEGNFKPYYDGQLGQHFQSLDEKKKWLKDNNYVQTSGPNNPQQDKKGNFRCTKSQAQPLLKKPTRTP